MCDWVISNVDKKVYPLIDVLHFVTEYVLIFFGCVFFSFFNNYNVVSGGDII